MRWRKFAVYDRGWNGNSMMLHRTPRVSLSPMTSTATPVSAATEQEQYHNDNQDQFHRISPLMAAANICRIAKYFNGVFEVLFPRSAQPTGGALRSARRQLCGYAADMQKSTK
ncbi:MAG TPA: hypothetical protein VII39_08205 [Bradyrhizobium sp.]